MLKTVPVNRLLLGCFFLSKNSFTSTTAVNYSILNMTSIPKWKSEKERILGLEVEEKRKLKGGDFITLASIETWSEYARKNSVDVKPAPTSEDVSEFKKITISTDMNNNLSGKVSIFKGDITKLEIDAIVNAANSRLKAGGGVDGAIHRAAGPLLQDECDSIGGCPTGEAKITGGYNLPAKYVIHTVGPTDKSPEKLTSCYENCLNLQKQYGITTIAFPCISTGIYGFPNRLAGHVALRAARKYLETNPNEQERIIFCTFMPVDVDIYETLMQMYFPFE